MQELSRWKATEFRLFFLYIGPIVLKNIINEVLYKFYDIEYFNDNPIEL